MVWWLINDIPKPIRKTVGGFKDKVLSLLWQTHLKIIVKKRSGKGGERNKAKQETKKESI